MLSEVLQSVREKAPLIHSITNYVTANDCANILLACGARPVMADYIKEVEEITSICAGLNINMGTLNSERADSMLLAGRESNRLNHPVLLDPVGVGVSKFRTEAAAKLLKEVRFTVIRGNISEIKSLASGYKNTDGVDGEISERINKEKLYKRAKLAKEISKITGSVTVITSALDIVADSQRAYCVYNGDEIMKKVTGTGCQLSALITAYISAYKEDVLKATLAAVCTMGLCGEIAKRRMGNMEGNASFRNYLCDALFNLRQKDLEAGAKYEAL